MSHPLAAAGQDVPSFVRCPIVCVIVRLVCNWVLVLVIYCNADCLQWLQVQTYPLKNIYTYYIALSSRNKSTCMHLSWTSSKKTLYEWVCMVFMHDVSSSQEMCKNKLSCYNYNECMAAGYPTAAWFLAAHPYLNLGIDLSNDMVAQLVGAW